ncbi:MAG: DNA repair protein RecO [Firmicutes bacterium]|nr:DNA repair protein RecO [[Eubacterium] siraeum]MCM1487081.1 DNA repair protein RecO [Bacillota bacterium]
MLVTVEGIVIGKRDIGENNCFIDVLTNQFGVIEATAHGVKKTNSSILASAGLFSYSKLCFNKNNLKYTLNSAEPKHSFFGLSSDLTKFSLAVYLADIIKYTSASEQNGEDILRFFAITLFELEKENADCDIIKAVFELRIASMLGFLPDLRACRGCGEYLKDTMYFSFDNSSLICGDCERTERKIGEILTEISHDLLYTLRYVVYSPVEKLYKFALKGKTRKDFANFCERYLLKQLDRGFKTLDYYKNIKG